MMTVFVYSKKIQNRCKNISTDLKKFYKISLLFIVSWNNLMGFNGFCKTNIWIIMQNWGMIFFYDTLFRYLFIVKEPSVGLGPVKSHEIG